MKKIMFFVSLLAIASLATILPVGAQEAANSVDLGVENSGMLPTNPFYFLKEWKRGINIFFTFNPVKKAELKLDEINQRAAEIKKMEEIAPQNIEAINKASSNYQKSAEQLKNRLENLKETGQNPNIDKLLDKLVDSSLKHQELFDNLEKKIEARQEISEQKITELKENFEANRERINEALLKVPEKFEDADSFNKRLEKTIENQPEGAFKELRAVEMLDRVKEKLPEEQRGKIQELKEGMIKKFETRMEKLDENEKMKISAPEVLETSIEKRGFKSFYWQCYDGTEQKQKGETSCKSSEIWQKYAKEFCENKCYADGSKCGVNSFSVFEECSTELRPTILLENVNIAPLQPIVKPIENSTGIMPIEPVKSR